ncbi:hypothetical protein AB0B48_15995 [Micromonospora sp. NPDC049089]|uniref:hypothetical protein n=1 Tax=Micromonospora sp. NPDC049089 TaxID=3155496 RepID=UPI003407F435
MGESVKPVGELQVLGQSRVWPGIAIPGVILLVMIVVGALFDLFSWTALVFGAGWIIIAVQRSRNAVFADDLGLLVRDRKGLQRSYAWDEIERMGWVDLGMWGASLAVNPRGGPYDVPGPNASINVGHIWRPGRRRSVDPVPELLKTHGIKALFDQ